MCTAFNFVSKVLEGENIKMEDEDCHDVEKYRGYAVIGYVGDRSSGI